jgi:ubiquinone/menaquinone biosynthesis C-methylase UbiE
MSSPRLPDEIRDHYENLVEEDLRIREGLGRLELVRTREVIRRYLSGGRLRILDVGGATGVHAEWLLAAGHRVHLVDPVPGLVDKASERLGELPGFSAEVGDARALNADDRSYDAVLLFGPLYHLIEREDRLRAWREAARVVESSGLVFGMGITRFASLFDGLTSGFLFNTSFRRVVDRDLETGQHRNPSRDPAWFTTAYFHHPDELAQEAQEAGLTILETVGIEGLAAWLPSLAERWNDPDDRETILFSARAVETETSLRGLSPHLVSIAQPMPGSS